MKHVKLTFKTGKDSFVEKEITHLVSAKSIKKTQTLCGQTGKSTVDECSFSLQYKRDPSLRELFLNQYQIGCKIENEDGSPFFVGIIPDGISQIVGAGSEEIHLSATENSYRLDNNCSTFALERIKVSDPGDTAGSIIHQLLFSAGYTMADIAITKKIETKLRVVCAEEGEYTWREILDSLLFEYGFVLFFDDAGKARIKEWNPSNTQGAKILNETNILEASGVERKKAEREFSKVCVYWSNIKDTADDGNTGKEPLFIGSVGFSVDPEGNEKGCDLAPNAYYPENYLSSTEPIYQNYSFDPLNYTDQSSDKNLFYVKKANKDLDLLYSYRHELSIRDSGGIYPNQALTVLKKEFSFKKAEILLQNKTPEMVTLFRFDVLAHAVFRYNKNSSFSFFSAPVSNEILYPGEDKVYEYTSKYIYDKQSAETLSNLIRTQKQFGAYSFSFSSLAELEVGDVVNINQEGEFSTFGVVEEKIITDEGEAPSYRVRGVAPYESFNAHSSLSSPKENPSQKIKNLESIVENKDKQIFGEGAFSLAPNNLIQPTIEAIPLFHANSIRVTGIKDSSLALGNIMNLQGYDYQCSLNGYIWYELHPFNSPLPQRDSFTTSFAPSQVHWHQFGVDEEGNPKPRRVYYRARLRTANGVVSAWSDYVDATASIIENGDIAANSITANKLVSNIIQTLLLRSQKVIISSELGEGGSLEAPKKGNKKIELDSAGFHFYICEEDGAWGEVKFQISPQKKRFNPLGAHGWENQEGFCFILKSTQKDSFHNKKIVVESDGFSSVVKTPTEDYVWGTILEEEASPIGLFLGKQEKQQGIKGVSLPSGILISGGENNDQSFFPSSFCLIFKNRPFLWWDEKAKGVKIDPLFICKEIKADSIQGIKAPLRIELENGNEISFSVNNNKNAPVCLGLSNNSLKLGKKGQLEILPTEVKVLNKISARETTGTEICAIGSPTGNPGLEISIGCSTGDGGATTNDPRLFCGNRKRRIITGIPYWN